MAAKKRKQPSAEEPQPILNPFFNAKTQRRQGAKKSGNPFSSASLRLCAFALKKEEP